MKKSKPVTQAFDDLTKKIEKQRIAREKLKTKKPAPMTIIAPKGCIIKELQPLVQIYVDKVLAYDQDWDHAFLLRMMIFKLSRMRKCLGNGWSADRKKVAAQILDVEEALKRLDKDDYELSKVDAVHKKHDVKFGTRKGDKGETFFATVPRKKNVTFDQKAYDADLKQAYKEANAERNDDLYIAFEGMKKNVLGWWD